MLRLLTRLGIRNVLRHKLFAGINIVGMALGLLSFILIGLYVQHEYSFDTFHPQSNAIYRLYSASKNRALATSPYVWGQSLVEELSYIENKVSIQKISSMTIKKDGEVFAETGVVATDSTFFQIFDFPAVQGNKNVFLLEPNKAVLTPAAAIKYFKNPNPIGEQFEVNLWGTFVPFEVQGIVECPLNSHLHFNILLPNRLVKKHFFNPIAFEHWRLHLVYTYLLFNELPDADRLKTDFQAFLHRHGGEELSGRYTPKIEPLQDIYLQSSVTRSDFPPRGSLANNRILLLVAFGILLMAIINFINISMAQSLTRAKEVILRKVLGSGRLTLILQFILESAIIAGVAMVLCLLVLPVVLPYFNEFTGKDFHWQTLFTWSNLGLLLVLSLFIGIISGLYPALMLSSFKANAVLGSRSGGKAKSATARKILVVGQFVMTGILLMVTGVIYQQIQFMEQKDLGFDKESIITISDNGTVSGHSDKKELLKHQLLANRSIKDVSASSTFPGQATWALRYIPDGYPPEESLSISTIFCDFDFLSTYEVEVLHGRNFNPAMPTDSNTVIINEAAAKFFSSQDASWTTEPIGKKIDWIFGKTKGTAEVIGVFKDFQFASFKNEIRPLVLKIEDNRFFNLQLRLNTANIAESISYVEQTWKTLFPEVPFNYTFLDQDFAKLYQADQKFGAVLRLIAMLSIVIAMLGLFGLASFLAIEKSKEMCIRKVVGASERNIVIYLSWLFLKLILVANLIALPIGYFFTNRWLESFAFRIDMPISVFIGVFCLTALVALFTISWHIFRVATTNPAKILAQE